MATTLRSHHPYVSWTHPEVAEHPRRTTLELVALVVIGLAFSVTLVSHASRSGPEVDERSVYPMRAP